MSKRLRAIIIALSVLAAFGIGGNVAMALNTTPVVSNDQINNDSNFACFNSAGIAYFEYRLPLPHPCNTGDVLVQEPPIRLVFDITIPAAVLGTTTPIMVKESCFTNSQDPTVDVETPNDYTCTVTGG